ncbi:MAG: Rnf-Nqr domain containing protein, partial [Aeromonas veronii]
MNQMEQIETGATPIAELESRKGELKELMSQGLWKNNPSLVQVLGLCPTLAVSSTFTNALGLGLATMAVLVCSNLAVSLVRNWVPK